MASAAKNTVRSLGNGSRSSGERLWLPPHIESQSEIRFFEYVSYLYLTMELQRLMEYTDFAFLNSQTNGKLTAVQNLINAKAQHGVSVRSVTIPDYAEIHSMWSDEAAFHKAHHSQLYIQSQNPDPEAVRIPTVGSDTNFWILTEVNGKQQWIQQTKLERINRKLAQEELSQEYRRQRSLLVEQKNIKCFWDVSTAIVNGGSYVGGMYLVVDAEPMTPEEFDAFWLDAVETGTIYASNSRGRLIEWLYGLGKVKKHGFVPHEYVYTHGKKTRGGEVVNVSQWMQEVRPVTAAHAVSVVPRTVPTSILGMRHLPENGWEWAALQLLQTLGQYRHIS